MTPKHWILTFLGLAIAVTGFVSGTNYLVDPYGKRQWWCDNKFKPIVNDRSFKYHEIFNTKKYQLYDSLILGSSRTMTLSSTHFQHAKPYNFGVHVANNAEKLFIFEAWLKASPLQKLYLGIDLHNFHPDDNIGIVHTERFTRQKKYGLVSLELLRMSFKSLKNQHTNQAQTFFNADGSLVYLAYEESINKGAFDFSDEKMERLAKNAYAAWENQELHVTQESFVDLLRIKNLADKNGVQIVPFFTPMHQTGHTLFHQNPNMEHFIKEIKEKIVDIFGVLHDFDTPHPHHQDTTNFYDLVHYRPSLSKQIVDTLEGRLTTYGIKHEK